MREFYPCALDDCEATAESLGLCHLHYQRIRYTGSPYKRGDPRFGERPGLGNTVPRRETARG